jgi:ketosteroid isomerase-like protein
MNRVRLILSAAASAALLTASAQAAQTSGPNAEVIAAVDAAMKASTTGDVPGILAGYAPDCAFADEFEPFFWSGPGAIQAYFTAGGRMYAQTRRKDDKPAFAPPSYVYVSGDRAFVVEKVSGTASVRGQPYSEQGAFAFVLARIDGRWKIISQTWTKTAENLDPYKD